MNRDWWRHPAGVLMVLQVLAIFVLGAVTVARFHIFAEVDERTHLAYVQEIAEHGRIPWVERDYVSWQELAIEQHTYPRPSGLDPRLLGLRGSSCHARADRLRLCLAYIAENPGVSNQAIASGIDLYHLGQTSTALSRLNKVGLLRKQAGGAGLPNAWWLTPHGEQVVRALEF